ncbi:MAG: hypothetical protein ABIJ03_02505 [Patescibacteria group bacterium]|nr:hypothetical protein [Patescibacteria group bacterium]
MKTWLARFPGLCLWLGLILWLFGHLVVPIQAETWGVNPGETLTTNPKDRRVDVTATMPDVVPPSTPILITPKNNALLRINQPAFSWYGSTDNVQLSHYQIWLDGILWFDNLPLISQTTANYTFTYLASDDIYQLTPSQSLIDGLHTWKVIIFDTSDNSNQSATWSFTIDTQAPVLVVTQVGSKIVAISSQDESTIPTSPIQLVENEPVLKGTGEAGALVHLDVIIPKHNNPTYLFTIGADGTWQVDLPMLPRDIEITLVFIITDPAGNVGILSGLKLIIVTPTIAIPATQVTPAPFSKFLPPSIVERLPKVIIPLLSPRELLFQTGRLIMGLLPPGIQDFLVASSLPIRQFLEHQPWLPNVLALIALILPVLIGTLTLAKQFGLNISPRSLIEIWRGLGLWPDFHPQGLVISSQTGQGLEFASLKLSGENDRQEPMTMTKITNQSGVYDHFRLPTGEYRVTVGQKYFTFPSLTRRIEPQGVFDWYQGGSFKLDEASLEPGLVIPLDIQSDLSPADIKRMRQRATWLKLASLTGPLRGGHFTLCLILTIIWPSVWNLIASGIYVISFFQNVIRQKTSTLVGQVIDVDQIDLPWVSLVWQTQAGQIIDAFITDQTGHFQSCCPQPDTSYLRVIKPPFWVAETSATGQSNIYPLKAPSKDTHRPQIITLRHP